jgi:hypothetical protein
LTPGTVRSSNFANDTTAAGAYRINAIRDLHGRADLLIETIARIDEIYAIRAAGRHF